MDNIPMNSSGPVDSQTVSNLNNINVQGPSSSSDINPNNFNQVYIRVPNQIPYPDVSGATRMTGTTIMGGTTVMGGNTVMGSSPVIDTSSVPTLDSPPPGGPAPAMSNTSSMSSAPTMDSAPSMSSAPSMNNTTAMDGATAMDSATASAPLVDMPIPSLTSPVQKGQKVQLSTQGDITKINAKLGWNITNSECDVDVSVFLLNNTGKVLGDSWFVFYGQDASPDGSTLFSNDNGEDRQKISVDFSKLNPEVSKMVFVLTINEALEKGLNFGMLKDVYIRIMDDSNNELVSFKMEDYYSNVTSMMIGEIYLHNGTWKFNAVGNGLAKDLGGLCELYGVQVE